MSGRRVGLVGGIASGKSLAARWFGEHGWSVLDADKVAHGLYAPGTAMCEEILATFGAGVRACDGGVDRAALGAIVFGDPERMRLLERIVHPALRRSVAEAVEGIAEAGSDVVLEMALLSRWPEMAASLDRVVGIAAAESLRRARLRARNGLSEEDAARRLARQEPEDALLSCASVVLRNEGTPAELFEALERIFPS